MRTQFTLKTTNSIQDWTAVPQNSIVKSEEYNLKNTNSCILNLQAALDTTTAHTGTKFIIQISGSMSGNEDWQNFVEFVGLIGTAATDLIENDPLAADGTSITLTGHAFTVEGEWLFIEDGTLIDSELIFESAHTTNAISLLDGVTNAHDVGVAIFNVAMVQNISIPGSANRVRLLVDNSYDSDGSTLNYKLRINDVKGV